MPLKSLSTKVEASGADIHDGYVAGQRDKMFRPPPMTGGYLKNMGLLVYMRN
jgi:hypothetical protein